MSQPSLVTVTGVAKLDPAISCGPAPSMGEVLGINVQASYSASKSGRPTIVNATDGSPFVLPLEGITKVRFLAVNVRGGGSFKLKLSSPNGGADQVVPLSTPGMFLLHVPNPGDELTAIKLVGNGDVEYMIAGDL